MLASSEVIQLASEKSKLSFRGVSNAPMISTMEDTEYTMYIYICNYFGLYIYSIYIFNTIYYDIYYDKEH